MTGLYSHSPSPCLCDQSRSDDRGYAMAALLVGMSVMAIVLSMVFGRHTRNLAWWQRGVLASFQAALALGVIGLLAGPALKCSK